MSTTSGGKDGGGPDQHPPLIQQASKLLGSPTMTPAEGRDSAKNLPCTMRSFAEILSDEKNHSEFFFDVLTLKVEDCVGIAMHTARHETKEI